MFVSNTDKILKTDGVNALISLANIPNTDPSMVRTDYTSGERKPNAQEIENLWTRLRGRRFNERGGSSSHPAYYALVSMSDLMNAEPNWVVDGDKLLNDYQNMQRGDAGIVMSKEHMAIASQLWKEKLAALQVVTKKEAEEKTKGQRNDVISQGTDASDLDP